MTTRDMRTEEPGKKKNVMTTRDMKTGKPGKKLYNSQT
jgi:hypothetical protein